VLLSRVRNTPPLAPLKPTLPSSLFCSPPPPSSSSYTSPRTPRAPRVACCTGHAAASLEQSLLRSPPPDSTAPTPGVLPAPTQHKNRALVSPSTAPTSSPTEPTAGSLELWPAVPPLALRDPIARSFFFRVLTTN
jgi:hypothetical protein